MRRFIKSRKGVSTVISTILMIMVTMIGMSILFGYVVFYSDNYKAGVGSSVMESLTIEDVWFKNSTAIQISVYNTGKVDSVIKTVYNNGVALLDSTGSINLKIDPIRVGEHAQITLKCPSGSWPADNNLKIVTQRGSNFEGQYAGAS